MHHLLTYEHFRTARESLRRTRMRTLLTVAGVAIGVASITAILALSGGITDIINRQVSDVGNNIVIVRPAVSPASLIDLGNPTPTTSYTTSPIEERDLDSIRNLTAVESAAPLMTISGSVRSKDASPKNVTVLATTPSFADTTKFTINDGQFLDDVTLENTAVVGEQLSIDLFGTSEASGKQFTIRGQTFTIVGTISRVNNPINYNNVDLDRTAIISLDSGKLFNQGVAQIQQIDIKAKPGTNITKLRSQIDTILKKNHDNNELAVLSGKEISAPTSRLFLLINGVMSVIAGISLVVGGIGIMNIMLVSVSERTREIGLRKAVGASNRSIVAQFMMESLIIGIIGGVLGYIGGYVIAFFVSLLLPYDPLLSWQIAAIALGLAVGVGVIFGVYPAHKAARKNPIESLRRYH